MHLSEQNFALIDRRWPACAQKLRATELPERLQQVQQGDVQTLVVDGIQLHSRYAPQQEARLQAALIPQGHAVVHVYGLAHGDLIRELLARTEVTQLYLVLMNAAVDRVNFLLQDHTDWLADPRVGLLDAATERELRLPFACAPSFLYLADDESSRLRDLLHLELSTSYLRQNHKSQEAALRVQLRENEAFVARDGDVADLFGAGTRDWMVVAAAGPTLIDQLGWMKKQRGRFQLIAADAAVRPLMAAGLVPDHVLTMDSAPALFDLFLDGLDLMSLANTGLVYSPLIHRKLLDAWPGKRFAVSINQPSYRDFDQKYPRGKLFSSGSVLHPAVDLAVKMGAKNVVLAGADFSFTKGQSHVAGSHLQLAVKTSVNCWVLNSHGDRVPSIRNYVGYLRDLERYIAWRTGVQFFNASQEGARIASTHAFDGEHHPWP
jgi:hypothetical protein